MVQLEGSSVETFLIIGKVSSEAVLEAKLMERRSILTWLSVQIEELLLQARLLTMQLALWLLQLRRALST